MPTTVLATAGGRVVPTAPLALKKLPYVDGTAVGVAAIGWGVPLPDPALA